MKLYSQFKTQDPENHTEFSSTNRLGQIRECSPPPPQGDSMIVLRISRHLNTLLAVIFPLPRALKKDWITITKIGIPFQPFPFDDVVRKTIFFLTVKWIHLCFLNRGYYMSARGYEFYLRVRDTFSTRRQNSYPQAAM